MQLVVEKGRVKVHAPDKLKSSIIEEQKSPFRTFKPNELDEKMPPFHVHDIIVVDKMIEKEKKKRLRRFAGRVQMERNCR